MLQHHLVLRDTAKPCKLDILTLQGLYHVVAKQHGHTAGDGQSEKNGRADDAKRRIRTRYGQDLQLDAEDLDHKDSGEEDGNRFLKGGNPDHQPVDPGVSFEGRQRSDGNRQNNRDQDRNHRKFQRVRELLEDYLKHRTFAGVGVPEISGQDIRDEDPVLYDQRLIKSELLRDQFLLLFGRSVRDQIVHRISGGSHCQEDDDGHDEDRDHRLQKFFHYVFHVSSSFVFSVASSRVSPAARTSSSSCVHSSVVCTSFMALATTIPRMPCAVK